MTTSELKQKLEKTLEHLQSELSQIRTGRVTPALLDSIRVDAYGTLLSVREVGTISIMDPQTLAVSPWDKKLLDPILTAIRNSELQLNPVIRSDSVVVPVPGLTEDRRKEFTRLAATKVEETKNAMRGIRQEAMKDIDTSFEKKEFGEDEKFTKRDAVEEVVKDFVTEADNLGEQKKQELLVIK